MTDDVLPGDSAATDLPAHRGVHPSPHRDRVGGLSMALCILGAPAAWSLQQIVAASLFAHGCFPKDAPLVTPIGSAVMPTVAAVEGVALMACLAAGLLAARNWRRTRGEKAGTGHHLVESGDGRSRFMAMVGLMCSGLFGLATLYAAALLFMVRPCGG